MVYLYRWEDWLVHRAAPRRSYWVTRSKVLESCPLLLKFVSLSLSSRKYVIACKLQSFNDMGESGYRRRRDNLEPLPAVCLSSVDGGPLPPAPFLSPSVLVQGSNCSRNPSRDAGVSSEMGEMSVLFPFVLCDLAPCRMCFRLFVGMSYLSLLDYKLIE